MQSEIQATVWPVKTAVLIKIESDLFGQMCVTEMSEKRSWNTPCVDSLTGCWSMFNRSLKKKRPERYFISRFVFLS